MNLSFDILDEVYNQGICIISEIPIKSKLIKMETNDSCPNLAIKMFIWRRRHRKIIGSYEIIGFIKNNPEKEYTLKKELLSNPDSILYGFIIISEEKCTNCKLTVTYDISECDPEDVLESEK